MAERNRRQAGFTLIEMVIALTLFASLIGLAMFGYSQGLSMWERASRQSAGWQAMEFRYDLLMPLCRISRLIGSISDVALVMGRPPRSS